MNVIKETINNALKLEYSISVISEEGTEISKSKNAITIYNMIEALESPTLRIWRNDQRLGYIIVDVSEGIIDYSDDPKIDAIVVIGEIKYL